MNDGGGDGSGSGNGYGLLELFHFQFHFPFAAKSNKLSVFCVRLSEHLFLNFSFVFCIYARALKSNLEYTLLLLLTLLLVLYSNVTRFHSIELFLLISVMEVDYNFTTHFTHILT